jgi:hypothetical protein
MMPEILTSLAAAVRSRDARGAGNERAMRSLA